MPGNKADKFSLAFGVDTLEMGIGRLAAKMRRGSVWAQAATGRLAAGIGCTLRGHEPIRFFGSWHVFLLVGWAPCPSVIKGISDGQECPSYATKRAPLKAEGCNPWEFGRSFGTTTCMKQVSFFREESAVAARQAKTDPLFLARTVKDAGESKLLPEDDIAQAHRILVKWADLEKSGQLATKTENELQGDLLEDVFGKALGYRCMVVTTSELAGTHELRTTRKRRLTFGQPR